VALAKPQGFLVASALDFNTQKEKIMTDSTAPISGSIPYALGYPVGAMGYYSVLRIPIPGTDGLCIELCPRGFVPKGGTTSSLFFQDKKGGRNLRLDYGYNIKTRTFDYHWNQAGTYENFGIPNHAPAGKSGAIVYNAAKYFKYAGRTLMLVGAGLDIYSIVESKAPLRRASEVVGGWALAWVGCKVVGAGGAAIGTAVTPGVGSAVGGVAGCIIGSITGYFGGSAIGATVYDWAETVFSPLEEVPPPVIMNPLWQKEEVSPRVFPMDSLRQKPSFPH
jgi:hypothetical protein